MDILLKINLTLTVLFFLCGVFKSDRQGINNPFDLFIVLSFCFLIVAWPTYVLWWIWS
jgi:hypothetical protein